MDFFSSDHHFFHTNICGFAGRPFSNLPDMHDKLIEDHNAVVTNNDRWWCLGDFSFGDSVKTAAILKRMNGQKFLIRGNHDYRRNIPQLWQSVEYYRELGVGDAATGTDRICMMHFPIMSWHGMHHGSYMLHGHCHGNLRMPLEFLDARILDVGVDNIWKLRGNYSPLSWEEIRANLRYAKPMALDHHATPRAQGIEIHAAQEKDREPHGDGPRADPLL